MTRKSVRRRRFLRQGRATDRNFFQQNAFAIIIGCAAEAERGPAVSGGRYVSGQGLFEIFHGVSFDCRFASG